MNQSPITNRWIRDPRAAAAVLESVINYFENYRLSQKSKYRKSAFDTLIFELHNRLAGNRPLLSAWTDHADIGAVLGCIDDYLDTLKDISRGDKEADSALFKALERHALTWRESVNDKKVDRSFLNQLY